jgi:RimJ/RimL family protein N-acetyltransferase
MSVIRLREIERADLLKINNWRNDPEVIRLLGANFLYIGPAIDEKWFDAYMANRHTAVRLAIVAEPDDLCIGLVSLTSIHAINRTAEFSIMLGDKKYWSKGIGQQATKEMLRHGFNDLNLNRIHLTVLLENVRARRLYHRLGFQEEGLQLQAVYKEGAFQDVIGMALLKEHFVS